MKASDLFVKALENEGVTHIFALPGEENLDLLDSIRKSAVIKLVLTRHEQGAGFMAATYGRLTGRPGVCLATLGPGATNMVTPAAYAQLGAMPMLIITGQKPVTKSKQGKFQIIDVVEMMRPLTKYTRQITHGHHIPTAIREAFRLAREERPGAVHIELPEDIAAEEVAAPYIYPVKEARTPVADKKSLQDAFEMINEAKCPLLLIGADANRKRCSEALLRFADTTGIPFFNTQMGKGVIAENHPSYIGTSALSDLDFLHEALLLADVIINVGHSTIEKPPFFMHPDHTQKVIHINCSPSGVDEIYFPHLNVVGDIACTIDELSEQLMSAQHDWDVAPLLKVRDNVQLHLSRYNHDDRFPLLPQRLVTIVREVLPHDGVVTLDNGMYKIWFARNFPVYTRNGLLLDNALATMGAGLPSALMVRMLEPHKKVISVNGDGGFMMNAQELETALRLKLDITILVLTDGGYGMIKWKQENMNLPPFGLDYTNPDFVKYAESFGAKGYKASSAENFKGLLEHCLREPGVHLIDVPIDYTLNHSILNEINKAYINEVTAHRK